MTHHLEWGAAVRARATELLLPITAALAVADGKKPAWEDVVLIDERRVRFAAQCLARPAAYEDEEYVETTGKARRRVGLAVLGVLRDQPWLDPMTAFELVLAERDRWLSDRLVAWVDQLGRGGRAALAQEAIGYATAVAAWVPPTRMKTVAISGASDSWSWSVPGRAVRIKARCDALAPRGGRPPDRRLLTVVPALDHAAEVGAHVALAYSLTTASVPARVRVLAPASGLVDVVVDDALLDGALDRAGAAAHAAIAARFGPIAATTAGPWCRHCARLDDCAAGHDHVARTAVRIGGLRPLDPA